MYGSSSNNGSNNCAETSISGEDEEKRSQAYSSQTDYAMVRIGFALGSSNTGDAAVRPQCGHHTVHLSVVMCASYCSFIAMKIVAKRFMVLYSYKPHSYKVYGYKVCGYRLWFTAASRNTHTDNFFFEKVALRVVEKSS